MIEKKFIDFGYTKEEYNSMRNKNSIKHISDATLTMRFNQLNDYLHRLGYTNQEIIKMLKSEPSLYNYSVETFKQKIDDMMSLGYTKKALMRMIKSYPTLCTLSKATINQKIESMMSLGYTKEEVMKITSMYSALFSLNIDSMRQKIDDIISMGYPKEEVMKITISFPSLYGLSIETIKKKIKFYDEINIWHNVVRNPKDLMQSANLSFARYSFYISQGIDINTNNYTKLFVSNKEFERVFGIAREKLLGMYDYDEYLAEDDVLNGSITDIEIYNTALSKRTNFVLDYLKANRFNKIDSIETQKEIEKIMIKKIFK